MTNTLQPTFEQLAVIMEDKLQVPRDRITPETALKDIEIDSLAMIEIMLAAEKQFDVEIPMEDIDTDGNVEDLFQIVLAAVDADRK
ncbi:MAG: hypothetical protein JO345_09010 [Streptosporangiaceae bacterium]|nr:hypothetical protein [Streptosporangiaceae bacterium]